MQPNVPPLQTEVREWVRVWRRRPYGSYTSVCGRVALMICTRLHSERTWDHVAVLCPCLLNDIRLLYPHQQGINTVIECTYGIVAELKLFSMRAIIICLNFYSFYMNFNSSFVSQKSFLWLPADLGFHKCRSICWLDWQCKLSIILVFDFIDYKMTLPRHQWK